MKLRQRLNLDCIIQRDPDVIFAEADKDFVMISLASGLYYGVSNVARDIWEAIEHPTKVCDLIDDLMGTYRIDRATCTEETLLFFDDLLAEMLLKVRHDLC